MECLRYFIQNVHVVKKFYRVKTEDVETRSSQWWYIPTADVVSRKSYSFSISDKRQGKPFKVVHTIVGANIQRIVIELLEKIIAKTLRVMLTRRRIQTISSMRPSFRDLLLSLHLSAPSEVNQQVSVNPTALLSNKTKQHYVLPHKILLLTTCEILGQDNWGV